MENKFIIDVETKDVKILIRKLGKLSSTISIENGGMYCWDKDYSQVHLTTNKTEKELDEWLYKFSHVDYVGIIEKEIK